MPIMGVGFTRVMSQSLSLLKTLANTAITRKTLSFSCFASQNKEAKSSAPARAVAFLLRKNKEDLI